MIDVEISVGGSARDDATDFIAVWEAAERGGLVEPRRVLAFQSWEAMAAVLTGERMRLLRHLHAHPEPSVSSLARSLDRQYRRVHADVTALEEAGLVDRSEGSVCATADRLRAEIQL